LVFLASCPGARVRQAIDDELERDHQQRRIFAAPAVKDRVALTRITTKFAIVQAIVFGLFFVAIAAASSPAFSNDEKSPNECGKYLTKMSEALDTLEALVPNVPPDEASYLEKEDAAAIQSGAGQRIFAVEHSRWYPAWHLHNEFRWAREAAKSSQTLAALPDLKSNLKITIVIASHIPRLMAYAKIAWDEFDNADHGQLLTLQQVGLGAEKSEYLIGYPGVYIMCLANFIQDTK
jgi:hypothetical protein